MDSATPSERCTKKTNGSVRRASPGMVSPITRPTSLMDHNQSHPNVVQVVVNRDEKGYGMKVSGDNPVYVQSVKEGGAAERAGLHSGDKIIKVNGVNVVSSTHTQVVSLIKASSQVVLSVQQKCSPRIISSPNMHLKSDSTPTSSRITSPQPVDNEKQYQLQVEKEQYYKLMIEKEQHYMDALRSQLAAAPAEKLASELARTERNLQTLYKMLQSNQKECPLDSPLSPDHLLPHKTPTSPNGNSTGEPPPPPLPKRNPTINNNNSNKRKHKHDNINKPRRANAHDEPQPPPLPPRSLPPDPDPVNSINKQMSYPLVATCATLVNNYSPNPTHHRTKSSPESLLALSGAEASKKLVASESMNDLCRESWENAETPPGTPPPPYPSPLAARRDKICANEGFEEHVDGSSGFSPFRPQNRVLANSSPIHAATPQLAQQPIISMEDDEISDQEFSQPEEQGPFKSFSRLLEYLPHLSVFTNYVLLNSDPNSLLFYLITDLYKEGNAKEMRKWAFEIHSCFLVPEAPLRLNNVDENIAREIDDVLSKESDKEEILRKVFWKARARAKEELTRQLADFQQKRTAGLGTMYGPADSQLTELYHDKQKELKHYEAIFLDKLDPFVEEMEKDSYNPKLYYGGAALATVICRVFQVRPTTHPVDKFPTFVTKDKSFRTKFIGRYSRKLNILNHQFVAQHYFTVIPCSNCQHIIYGIGPQGYQCTTCHINLHRHCVKLYDDFCPGPINKKDKGLTKFIRMRHENDHRRKQSANFIQMEKERRQMEERDPDSFDISGEVRGGSGQPVSRSGSDRRPDQLREEHRNLEGSTEAQHDSKDKDNDNSTSDSTGSLPGGNGKKKVSNSVGRSESVKEQQSNSSGRKQQRRNISDPLHNTSAESELDQSRLPTDSGSSSNNSISYIERLSWSPEQRQCQSDGSSDCENEEVSETNWQNLFTEEELREMGQEEEKRQNVIDELFKTEERHVGQLRVLYKVFYKKLSESDVLKPHERDLIFPNIKELLDIHTEFSKEMKKKRADKYVRDLGELLVRMFQGDGLQRAAATFCERQQRALDFIKDKRRRDNKFETFLTECEKHKECRRLPLQGIIPVEMQRLSKYPLLLERLLDTGKASEAETEMIRQAVKRSREVLNHVNEAAKIASNRDRLQEIHSHLDTSNFDRMQDNNIVAEYRKKELINYKLLAEGDLQLRRPNKNNTPVHVLLMDEAVFLLHREGEKFALKFFQSGLPTQPNPLSPIVKFNNFYVRHNAACKTGLFLVSAASNLSQMYDLVADDVVKRDMWIKQFTEAAEAYAQREGRGRSQDPNSESDETESVHEIPPSSETLERAEQVGGEEGGGGDEEESDRSKEEIEENGDVNAETDSRVEDSTVSSNEGGIQTTHKVSAEEWPLIQPSQVCVEKPPVHLAESKITILEQIKRKDADVTNALADKENLLAEMFNIPKEEFSNITEMAAQDNSGNREVTDRILYAICQVDLLTKAVNKSMNISEGDAVRRKGGKHATCASQAVDKAVLTPSVPADFIREISGNLSNQLNSLLQECKAMEEDRQKLRKELKKLREVLHVQHNLHGPDCHEEGKESEGEAQGPDFEKENEVLKEDVCEH